MTISGLQVTPSPRWQQRRRGGANPRYPRLLTGGSAVPLFTSPAEEASFTEAAGLLEGLVRADESRFIRRLAGLALPASDGIDIRHMVEVRHEEVFARFRSRQRTALAVVGDGNDAHARRMYRQEMQAAAEEVDQLSSRSLLAKFTVPMAVGWTTGAIVVGVAGWKAALAALVANSVMDAGNGRERHAQRALHHHYATLSASPNE
ncbi:hypothetical protein [Catellatospora sp. NPDC049133]|jgi:hypothetical protein|uniref:hypothetical protein n=1 Tax=Catellatospora sp. NPDC049133 TaxID=3155499 RepID=UPI0033F81D1A